MDIAAHKLRKVELCATLTLFILGVILDHVVIVDGTGVAGSFGGIDVVNQSEGAILQNDNGNSGTHGAFTTLVFDCIKKQMLARGDTTGNSLKTLAACSTEYCNVGHGDSGCGSVKHFTSPCGQLSGLTSGFRGRYIPNQHCIWVIEVSQGYIVNLTFEYFNLVFSENCRYDSVEVYDGRSLESTSIGKFCGSVFPWSSYSSTNFMAVVFKTDEVNEDYLGFRAFYEPLSAYIWKPIRFTPNAIYVNKTGRLDLSLDTVTAESQSHYHHQFHVRTDIGKLFTMIWVFRASDGKSNSIVHIHDGPSAWARRLAVLQSSTVDLSGNITAGTYQFFIVIKQSKLEADLKFSATFSSDWLQPCGMLTSETVPCIPQDGALGAFEGDDLGTEDISNSFYKVYDWHPVNGKAFLYGLGLSLEYDKPNGLHVDGMPVFNMPQAGDCQYGGLILFINGWGTNATSSVGPFCASQGKFYIPIRLLYVVLFTVGGLFETMPQGMVFYEIEINTHLGINPLCDVVFHPQYEVDDSEFDYSLSVSNRTDRVFSRNETGGKKAKVDIFLPQNLTLKHTYFQQFTFAYDLLTQPPSQVTDEFDITISSDADTQYPFTVIVSFRWRVSKVKVRLTASRPSKDIDVHIVPVFRDTDYFETGLFTPTNGSSQTINLQLSLSDYLSNEQFGFEITVSYLRQHYDCWYYVSAFFYRSPFYTLFKSCGQMYRNGDCGPADYTLQNLYNEVILGTLFKSGHEQFLAYTIKISAVPGRCAVGKWAAFQIKEYHPCNATSGECLISYVYGEMGKPFQWTSISNYRLVFTTEIPSENRRDIVGISAVTYALDHEDRYSMRMAETGKCTDAKFGGIQYRDTCYDLFVPDTMMSWADAHTLCTNKGGMLGMFHDDDDLDYVKNVMARTWFHELFVRKRSLVFIGLRSSNGHSTSWPDGTSGVTDWYEPDISKPQLDGKLSNLHLDSIRSTFIDPNIKQPMFDEGRRCTLMVFTSPRISSNWMQIPCYLPMNQSSALCMRSLNDKAEGTGAKNTTSYHSGSVIGVKLQSDGASLAALLSPNTCPHTWWRIGGFCYKPVDMTLAITESNVYTGDAFSRDVDALQRKNAYLSFEGLARELCHESGWRLAVLTKERGELLPKYLLAYRLPKQRETVIADTDFDFENSTCVYGSSIVYFSEIVHSLDVKLGQRQFRTWETMNCTASIEVDDDKFLRSIKYALCERDPVLGPVLKCTESEFFYRCSDGTCILKHHVCDGVSDCVNGDDELRCREQKVIKQDDIYGEGGECGIHGFSCNNKQCIPSSKFCDFYPDCTDKSDEAYCQHPICAETDFRCNSGQCLPLNRRCDRVKDCLDGSDEGGCEAINVDCTGFVCHSGNCLADRYIQDGVIDCPGNAGEDENTTLVASSCGADMVSCVDNSEICFPPWNACIQDVLGDGTLASCRNGDHLKGCQDIFCSQQNLFKCPQSYCIHLHSICDGVINCPGAEDEENCTAHSFSCPGAFRGKSDRHCVHVAELCDGQKHCKNSIDDELFCVHTVCPHHCDCLGESMQCSYQGLSDIPLYSYDLRGLLLSGNPLELTNETFTRFVYLVKLDISNCEQVTLPKNVFHGLYNIRELDISHNNLTIVEGYLFKNLHFLTKLNIANNPLSAVLDFAFLGLRALPSLSLAGMNIGFIGKNALVGLSALRIFDLSHNNLDTLYDETLVPLTYLKQINLEGNSLNNVNASAFASLHANTIFKGGLRRICCLAAHVTKCTPKHIGQTTCSDLISDVFLRVIIWLLGLVIVIENFAVIIWVNVRESKMTSVEVFLIVLLAFAQILSGTYMLTIAGVDLRFRGEFYLHINAWPRHWVCKLAACLLKISVGITMYFIGMILAEDIRMLLFPDIKFQKSKYMVLSAVVIGFYTVLNGVTSILIFSNNSFCTMFVHSDMLAISILDWLMISCNFLPLAFIVFLFFVLYKSWEKIREWDIDSDAYSRCAHGFIWIVWTAFLDWCSILIAKLYESGVVSVVDSEGYLLLVLIPISLTLNPLVYVYCRPAELNYLVKEKSVENDEVESAATTRMTSVRSVVSRNSYHQ